MRWCADRWNKAEQHVARADLRAGEQALAFDCAHDEARQVVLARRVETGHFRRFATDQRASVRGAAARDAAYHFRCDARVQLSHREIVEEKQRHRTLHSDVIDAVVHQVFADGGVPSSGKRQLELGAHAVGRGHQHRVAVAAQPEPAAKTADISQDVGAEGLLRQGADGGDGAVSLVDVDPRVFIV